MSTSRVQAAKAAAASFSLDREDGPDYCEFAYDFARWSEELFDQVLAKPSVIAVNQAKVLLLDKYYMWFNSIPRRHSSMTGRLSHICVDVVFDEGYRRLRRLELRLAPPPIEAVRKAPAPEPTVPLLGVRFGDWVPGGEEVGS